MGMRLLAHVELEDIDRGALGVAADLADRLKAEVQGLSVCQPLPALYQEGVVNGIVLDMDRAQIGRESHAAEARFRAAMARQERVEWRSLVTYGDLAECIAAEARGADLIVTGTELGGMPFDTTRRVSLGELVMSAGRPVLIVPQGIKDLALDHVLIAWKDSRESRRAVLDALPLLKLAGKVSLVEIALEPRLREAKLHLAAVAGWLAVHGIKAETKALARESSDAATLRQVMEDENPDLVVAGGFGRARLSEWVFGGVTLDLLLSPDRCILLSH